jgi:ABC-2 type transport system permease protein
VKALAIAGINLRRLARERSNAFFVLILPMLIILLLGAAFGGRTDARLGVLSEGSGRLGAQLVAALEAEDDLELRHYADREELLDDVERGAVSAGLVVPRGYDGDLRAGRPSAVGFAARPESLAQQLRTVVQSAVSSQSAELRAARLAAEEMGVTFEQGLAAARGAAALVPGISVEATAAGEPLFPEDLGRYERGASTQLLLFVFLTSLTASVMLIETRRLGVSRRMLSTPTSSRAVIVGEALGRYAVALVQGLLIMGGSALLFGVGWGNAAGAVLVLLVFALVGSGGGMLLGSVASNDQQALAVGLLLGLGLAALGGSMVPLEIFPDAVRSAAHVTPHAWGNDAFADLLGDGGGVGSVLPELGILAGYAVVLLALAGRRLRVAITG